MKRTPVQSALMLLMLLGVAHAQYPGWQHSGSLYVLTTPEAANLPATAVERDFPLLVRLNKGVFDFGQARPNGEDVRFSVSFSVLTPFPCFSVSEP